MTDKQAREMQFVVNIDAAAAYADSDLKSYMDGYEDGMNHEFDMTRGMDDNAYFDGYQKAVNDEQMQRDLGWLVDLDHETNQPGYAERYGQF